MSMRSHYGSMKQQQPAADCSGVWQTLTLFIKSSRDAVDCMPAGQAHSVYLQD
jgi:hypothetical protein